MTPGIVEGGVVVNGVSCDSSPPMPVHWWAGHARDTIDEFIGAVPITDQMVIVVFRRRHAGKVYVRWRAWHDHPKWKRWYPDKRRCGTIAVDAAPAFADAIRAAAEGEQMTEWPGWLAHELDHRQRRVRLLRDLNAPTDTIDHANRMAHRMPGERKLKRRRP